MENFFDKFDEPNNFFDQFDSEKPAPPAAPSSPLRDAVNSRTGRGVSAVVRGVAPYAAGAGAGFLLGGPPGAAAGAGAVALSDLAAAAYNNMPGIPDQLLKRILPSRITGPTEATNAGLDAIGLPRPETGMERVLQAGAQGLGGAYSAAKTAASLASTSTSPVAKEVAASVASRPGTQAVSGFSSGVSGQTTKEAGFGPTAQVAATIAGAMVPYGFTDFSSFLARATPKALAKEAVDAGYSLPPRMASDRPSIASEGMSAVAGKAKIDQLASVKNQEITNRLATQDLGLPKNTELTPAVFNGVRNQAGKAYEAVRNAVPKSVSLKYDTDFVDQINKLGDGMTAGSDEFPTLMSNADIEQLKSGILNTVGPAGSAPKNAMSPAAGLDLVRKLRQSAVGNFKTPGAPEKHALAMAQRDAADAIDGLIERRLTQLGKPDLVKQYQAARQLLAKAYDVEAATNVATGDVSARGIARLLDQGKPLTGGLLKIGRSAAAFPRAFQNPATFGSVENWSALDYFGAAYSALHGDPAMAAGFIARPAIRGSVLSQPYQRAMVAPQAPGGPLSVLTGPITQGATSPNIGPKPPSAVLGLNASPPRIGLGLARSGGN